MTNKYICPNCRKVKVVRLKSKGRIPNCKKCKEIHRLKHLSVVRDRRASGIYDSHRNKKTGLRYGIKPMSCRYCKTIFVNKRQGLRAHVCSNCIPHHKELIKFKNSKAWHRDPNHLNRLNLKRRLINFGINEQQFDKTHKCDICGTKNPGQTPHGNNRVWSIDHDHNCCKTGCQKCMRGLLCYSCNLGLGNFRDSINSLQAAINYLKRSYTT